MCGAVMGLLALAFGCSDIDQAAEYRELQSQLTFESQEIWEVLPLDAADVERVVVYSDDRNVEVRRSGSGQWISEQGAAAVTGSLMFDVQRVLFPLLSYRQLTVDSTDPAFGLRDSSLGVTVHTWELGMWDVQFGAVTFTGGGHYAKLGHDPRVYTVIPRVIDGLLSVLLAEKVDRGIDPRFAAALNELQLVTVDEEELNPWLAQVLEYEDQ